VNSERLSAVAQRIETDARKPAPPKSPKTAKRWKSAGELEQLLAERAGVPVHRVTVFGSPGNWDATYLANMIGNVDRKARFKSIVSELQRDYDLSSD
jgi:hypothetical protein